MSKESKAQALYLRFGIENDSYKYVSIIDVESLSYNNETHHLSLNYCEIKVLIFPEPLFHFILICPNAYPTAFIKAII